jgi:hypothetical protein
MDTMRSKTFVALFKALFRNLLEGLKKTTKNFSQNIKCPADVRTEHLSKTSQKIYRLSQLAR